MNNDVKRDERDLFAGLEPPPPPADLRVRALDAARGRMAEADQRDLWSRIWNSRGVRLAWAAAVVFLLAGHVLVSTKSGSAVPTRSPILAGDHLDEQFLGILRPVEINADAHPTMGLFAEAADLNQIEKGGNPS